MKRSAAPFSGAPLPVDSPLPSGAVRVHSQRGRILSPAHKTEKERHHE